MTKMPYKDIVIVLGPAGSSKNTLISEVSRLLPEYRLARSATTRGLRPSDDPAGTGLNSKYIYVSPERFAQMVEEDAFLEHNDEYAGHAYGTLQPATTFCPILEIDLVGAKQVKAKYPQARVVFVTVQGRTIEDTLTELEGRIRKRSFATGALVDESDLKKRLKRAEQELAEGPPIANIIIVNKDLELAAAELLRFIRLK